MDQKLRKHTPGPWYCECGYTIWGPKDFPVPGKIERVATVAYDEDDASNERSMADARLIASAPDLLAGLKEALATGLKAHVDVIERLGAIVARAEGR